MAIFKPRRCWARPSQPTETESNETRAQNQAAAGRRLLAAGSSGNTVMWSGDVQISPVGTSGARCFVQSWSQELTPSINIECVNKSGNIADSPFTVEWVVP
jgi:hypothetical protein